MARCTSTRRVVYVDALQLPLEEDGWAPTSLWKFGVGGIGGAGGDVLAIEALEVVDSSDDGQLRAAAVPFSVSINAQQYWWTRRSILTTRRRWSQSSYPRAARASAAPSSPSSARISTPPRPTASVLSSAPTPPPPTSNATRRRPSRRRRRASPRHPARHRRRLRLGLPRPRTANVPTPSGAWWSARVDVADATRDSDGAVRCLAPAAAGDAPFDGGGRVANVTLSLNGQQFTAAALPYEYFGAPVPATASPSCRPSPAAPSST